MRPAVPVGKRTTRFRLPLAKSRPVGQQAYGPIGNRLSGPEQRVRTIIEQAFADLPPLDISGEPTSQDLATYNRQTLNHFTRFASRLEEVLAEQYWESAQLAAREIAALVSRQFRRVGKAETPPPSELIAEWSLGDDLPRAQEWAKQEAGSLITNMTREQQQTFRNVVDQSYSLGRTPGSTARPLIDALNEVEPSSSTAQAVRNLFGTNVNGLTVRYEQAVVNRATKLASDLEARGVSADKIIERVGKDTQKYADKLRRSRANTIARTEILRANNEGRLAGFQEASSQGILSSQYARKVWSVSPMDVCPICVPLDGQQQPLDAPFTNGTLTPPAHPNCRCSFDIEPNIELYEPPPVLGSGTPEDPFRVGDIGEFTTTGQGFASRPLISGQPTKTPTATQRPEIRGATIDPRIDSTPILNGVSRVRDVFPNAPHDRLTEVTLSRDITALANKSRNKIYLNEEYWNDASFWEKRIADIGPTGPQDRGRIMSGSGIDDVISHEYGHMVHGWLQDIDRATYNRLDDFLTEEVTIEGLVGGGSSTQPRWQQAFSPDHPSIYATESKYEFIAESILDFVKHGPNARPWSIEVVQIIRRAFG